MNELIHYTTLFQEIKDRIRAVTHCDVSREQCQTAIEVIKHVLDQ